MSTQELIPLQDVENALLHGEDVAVVEPAQVSADIIRRVLASETLEDAFQSFDSTPAKDIDGILVTVHSVDWMRSAYEEGAPVYALMRVTEEGDAKVQVVSIGGRTVLAGLLWAQRNDQLPLHGVFRLRQSRSNPENSYWTFSLAVEAKGKK